MRVSVIGLGYVGLPLAALLAKSHTVVGFDIDERRIDMIRGGHDVVKEPGLHGILKDSLKSGRLTVTAGRDQIRETEVKIITVGTPYDEKRGSVDYAQLDSALDIVTGHIKNRDVIVLKSTVPPGTTNGRLRRAVELAGFRIPGEVGLAYCPERLVEGQAIEDLGTLPKPIGATDKRSQEKVAKLFECLGGKIIRVSNPETAELIKILDNYARYAFLGLTNEVALIAEKCGVNVYELLNSAKDNYPRNAGLLKPGPGVGGSCLNKDPFILRSEMKKKGLSLRMIGAAKSVNDKMPLHIAGLVSKFSGHRRKVCIAGVAFKGDTDDTRFSTAFEIREELKRRGFRVMLTDPYVVSKKVRVGKDLYSTLSRSDILLVLCDHAIYKKMDLDKIKLQMRPNGLIIDTRDVVDKAKAEETGFEYHGLGRL